MRSCVAVVCSGIFLLLQGAPANSQVLCDRPGSDSVNDTLENLIHLSDVVLPGLIGSAGSGEYGTYSARIYYTYLYKNDGLMAREFFGVTTVKNFMVAPRTGQASIFFLLREPSMRLALFCIIPYRQLTGDLEETLEHILEVGSSKLVHACSNRNDFC